MPVHGQPLVGWVTADRHTRARQDEQPTTEARSAESEFLSDRQCQDALEPAGAAEWPSPARPGRIDYVHAEPTVALVDKVPAERYYLSTSAADPDFFCVLGGQTVLCAGSDFASEQRARMMGPHVEPAPERFRLRAGPAVRPRSCRTPIEQALTFATNP